MVNLVLQQKNSGCAVLNGPGNKRLTVPPLYVVYFADKDTFFSGGIKLSSHGLNIKRTTPQSPTSS